MSTQQVTPLQQMHELWRGIARLHRSDACVQPVQRGRLKQQNLGVLADSIASLMNCYALALAEVDAGDSSRVADAQS